MRQRAVAMDAREDTAGVTALAEQGRSLRLLVDQFPAVFWTTDLCNLWFLDLRRSG